MRRWLRAHSREYVVAHHHVWFSFPAVARRCGPPRGCPSYQSSARIPQHLAHSAKSTDLPPPRPCARTAARCICGSRQVAHARSAAEDSENTLKTRPRDMPLPITRSGLHVSMATGHSHAGRWGDSSAAVVLEEFRHRARGGSDGLLYTMTQRVPVAGTYASQRCRSRNPGCRRFNQRGTGLDA